MIQATSEIGSNSPVDETKIEKLDERASNLRKVVNQFYDIYHSRNAYLLRDELGFIWRVYVNNCLVLDHYDDLYNNFFLNN